MKLVSTATLTFHRTVTPAESELFEREYPAELQECSEVKQKIFSACPCVWLKADGEAVAELIGGSVFALNRIMPDDPVVDLTRYDMTTYYVFATTVLSQHQGRGYASLLKAYMIGMLPLLSYSFMAGHATTMAAVNLNLRFGASFDTSKVHHNWFGSGRTARFYKIKL